MGRAYSITSVLDMLNRTPRPDLDRPVEASTPGLPITGLVTGLAEMDRMSVNSVSAGTTGFALRPQLSPLLPELLILARLRIDRDGEKRGVGLGTGTVAESVTTEHGVGQRGAGCGGFGGSEDSVAISTGGGIVSVGALLSISSSASARGCDDGVSGGGGSGVLFRNMGSGAPRISLASNLGGVGEGSSTRGRPSGALGAITAPLKCELRMRAAGRVRDRNNTARGRSGRGADGGLGMKDAGGSRGASGAASRAGGSSGAAGGGSLASAEGAAVAGIWKVCVRRTILCTWKLVGVGTTACAT